MKIFLKIVHLLIFISISLLLNGCPAVTSDVPLNIPISINFTTSGSDTEMTETKNTCLTNNDEWSDNADDINSASLVSIAYWTTAATSGLKGDITFTLKDKFGTILFSKVLNNVAASDNIDTPYTLPLTSAEKDAINNYINSTDYNNICFISILTIDNITAGVTPYSLSGKVEVVIEVSVDL